VVFTLAFFLTLLDYDLFRLFTYGLETGIYLCLEAVCFFLSLRMMQAGKASWRQTLLLGLAGGLAGLARIDFGILFALLLGWMLVRRVLSPLCTLCCGFIALAITGPWFIFVHSVSGSWLPSSGKAESRFLNAHDGGRFIVMIKAVLAHLSPWVYSNLPQSAIAGLGALSVIGMGMLLVRSHQTRRWLTGYLRDAAPWTAGVFALVTIYLLFFSSTFFTFVMFLCYLSLRCRCLPFCCLNRQSLRRSQR